jgi:hypothetical protein
MAKLIRVLCVHGVNVSKKDSGWQPEWTKAIDVGLKQAGAQVQIESIFLPCNEPDEYKHGVTSYGAKQIRPVRLASRDRRGIEGRSQRGKAEAGGNDRLHGAGGQHRYPRGTDGGVMERDPIVEEVRRVRREIEAECGNDAQKYFEHLTELQKQYTDRLVCLGPKSALRPCAVAEGKAMYGTRKDHDAGGN